MPKTTKKHTARKLTIAHPEPIPAWLVEMPWEAEYRLTMAEGGRDCQDCQRVELTRNEYIALKLHLAGLRGIVVPEQQPDMPTCHLPTLWSELEPEEIAAANRASKLVATEDIHA